MKFTNTDRVKEKVGANMWQLDMHIDNQVYAHVFWEMDDYFDYFRLVSLEIKYKIEQELNK